MKTCIYVFSGTGTSLAVAKIISDSLGDAEIVLIPIALKNAKDNEIEVEATTVGFVFPNYFGGVPDMVKKLIRVLDIEKAEYIFSVVTGGKGRGRSLQILEQELINKGKKLNYGKSITGMSNYIVGWYYILASKTSKQRDNFLGKLEQKANYFAKDIACHKNEIEKSQFFSYMISHLLSPKEIIKDTRTWDRDFSIHENCIGCRTCEKVCQAYNIKIINNKPVYQHNCQRCMGCLQYCPQNAIGFKGKLLKKPKYYHSDYPAKTIIDFIQKKK